MSEHTEQRTPFVLGKPIKNPADFYGRKQVLRELFRAIANIELVAVVGEHRCGNTSVLYMLAHDEMRDLYLPAGEGAPLLPVFVSCQLANEGPEAFYRRLSLAARRADPDAGVDFGGVIDRVWVETYLEDVVHRGRRLVLLLDEFEVLARFDEGFWEWFQVLVTEYDVPIVASTRFDLSHFRAERGGPPFFSLFRSVHIGSFSPETVETFLREKSEITDFDFFAVQSTLRDLAGRFPFYLQVAAALFYFHAGGESRVSTEQTEAVIRDFKARAWILFEDAWPKLPPIEREALVWLASDGHPHGDALERFEKALVALEQRGYVIDGHIFSSAFAEYVREHAASG